jgi:hypothetical protein
MEALFRYQFVSRNQCLSGNVFVPIHFLETVDMSQ